MAVVEPARKKQKTEQQSGKQNEDGHLARILFFKKTCKDFGLNVRDATTAQVIRNLSNDWCCPEDQAMMMRTRLVKESLQMYSELDDKLDIAVTVCQRVSLLLNMRQTRPFRPGMDDLFLNQFLVLKPEGELLLTPSSVREVISSSEYIEHLEFLRKSIATMDARVNKMLAQLRVRVRFEQRRAKNEDDQRDFEDAIFVCSCGSFYYDWCQNARCEDCCVSECAFHF